MFDRKPVFPNVIEVNHQVGHVLGCNVYIVYDDQEWVMIDIGYSETVDEIVELIRQLDFPLSKCKMLIATHADVDHIQGLAQAKQILRASVAAHPLAVEPLQQGDKLRTFAEIAAQGIHLDMPAVEVEHQLNDGDHIEVGRLKLEIWHTARPYRQPALFPVGQSVT